MKIPIIIFGLLYTVYCKPSYPDYIDDTPSDNEEYDDIGDDDETNKTVEEKPLYITTVGETFVKNLTETVVLPCSVSGINYVHVWRKNGTILFQANMRMGATNDTKQLKNGALEISNLKKNDSGDYECLAMSSQENSPKITHTLLLRTPPNIEFFTVKDNKTVLKTEDTLSLTCKASGYPKPVISWHKGSERLATEGEFLTISSVKHHDAGQYKCLADNSIGNPSFAYVDIRVEFKPIVSIEHISVSSENNVDTELKCMVHSIPKAQVIWEKDGVKIKKTEHIELSTKKGAHIILIKRLEESDFGLYTCSASNYLGTTTKNVTLVKTPAIRRLIKPQSDSKELVLTWKIQSKSPILAHELQYRKKGESNWDIVRPDVSDPENEIYTAKYTLKGVDPGVYETKIRSQNNNGWSESLEIVSFGGDKQPSGSSSLTSALTFISVIVIVEIKSLIVRIL